MRYSNISRRKGAGISVEMEEHLDSSPPPSYFVTRRGRCPMPEPCAGGCGSASMRNNCLLERVSLQSGDNEATVLNQYRVDVEEVDNEIKNDSSVKLRIPNDNEEERKNDDRIYPLVLMKNKHYSAESYLPKLLIVDDSHVCRNMLVRALVSRCRVCDEAEDGRQALEMMKASIEADDPYDVVLMDLQMPLVNGSEAAKHMREALGYGGVIIGLTGNALPEDLDAFKSAGADDVLVKPMKVHQFETSIRNILAKKSVKKS